MDLTFVSANGLRFACFDSGHGPLALCLHGFPDTPHTWRDIAPVLVAAGYRVVAPYQRGYPPTSLAADKDYSSVALGRDVLALIEALGETRAVVIGHDWGALAAYSAANQGPEHVSKLVVISIPHPSTLRTNLAQLSKSSHFVTFQWRGRTLTQFRDPAGVRNIYRLWSPGWDVAEDELGPIREVFAAPGGLEGPLGYYWSFGRDALLPGRKAAREVLRRTTSVPTLALYGDRDGALDASTFAASRGAFSGQYEVVCLPGVGHFVHREAPQAFKDHLLRFLGAAGLAGP